MVIDSCELKPTGIFTYGSLGSIITPILSLYPEDPTIGSPYFTDSNLFGLTPSYKRAASLIGDLLFEAPRRHFLRETPKDFGVPSWSYMFDQADVGDKERMGGELRPSLGASLH